MNLLLVDLSSIAHAQYHVSASDPNPDATSLRTLERVRALASGQPHTVIACEGGRSFRKDVDPTYKATRPEHDAALHHQIALVVDSLKAEGYPVWSVPTYEADDIIGSAVALALLREDVERITIASADKDLLQLVNDRVVLHKLTDGSTVDAAAVQAKYGVSPAQFVDYLSLCGDTSDNILGAKGIGPKKAAAMLAKYGNLEDLYAALDADAKAFQPATVAALEEFRPRMATVRELVRLKTDAPLSLREWIAERQDIAVFEGEEPMDEIQAPAASHPILGASQSLPSKPNGGDSDSRGGGPELASETPVQEPSRAMQVVTPQALAPRPADFSLTDGPQTYAQAKLMASDLFAAKLFNGYGNPAAVLATILVGKELGLSTGVSLRGIHIIESKQSFSADLIRSLCLRSPVCEYFRVTERTPARATWITKRKGDPEVSLTFTIEEGRIAWAKDQKAWDASGWGKRPVNMVTKTASSQLARLVYPDVALGMYCHEELTGEDS